MIMTMEMMMIVMTLVMAAKIMVRMIMVMEMMVVMIMTMIMMVMVLMTKTINKLQIMKTSAVCIVFAQTHTAFDDGDTSLYLLMGFPEQHKHHAVKAELI